MKLTAQYSEYIGTPAQKRNVETLWSFVADQDNESIVLPDGRCDVIFRFRAEKNGSICKVRCVVTGPATIPYVVRYQRRDGWVGIRLRPDITGTLWKHGGKAGLNAVVSDAGAVFRLLPALAEIAEDYDDSVSLWRAVESVAGSFMAIPSDLKLRRALNEIHLSGGQASINDIATRLSLTPRHLHRRFLAGVGIPPKTYSNLVRFHRALRLRRDLGLSPTETAFEAGYSDQAHLTRSFRKYGGFTPSRLPPNLSLPGFSEIKNMSEIFNSDLKIPDTPSV